MTYAAKASNHAQQIKLIKFLVKHPNDWHSFHDNKETVALVCATANLGILETNEHGQMHLLSVNRAKQFLPC